MTRAELSLATGVGTRTLYALEEGESENIGLGRYLRILDALGLSLSIDISGLPNSTRPEHDTCPSDSPKRDPENKTQMPWNDLADIWKLDRADLS